MQTRWLGPEQQTREIVDRAMRGINTAIPGKILSFDAATHTATIQPAVQMRTRIDDKEEHKDLPSIINAPIVFPISSSTGFGITIPVHAGDSCLIIFSQRAIDNWHDRGGIQPPEEGVGTRHHDMTDAFAVLAPVSKPDVLPSYQTDGIEIRNGDRNIQFKITNDGMGGASGTSSFDVAKTGNVEFVAPAQMTVTTPKAQFSTLVHSLGDVTALSVSLYNHRHICPACGAQTSPPINEE